MSRHACAQPMAAPREGGARIPTPYGEVVRTGAPRGNNPTEGPLFSKIGRGTQAMWNDNRTESRAGGSPRSSNGQTPHIVELSEGSCDRAAPRDSDSAMGLACPQPADEATRSKRNAIHRRHASMAADRPRHTSTNMSWQRLKQSFSAQTLADNDWYNTMVEQCLSFFTLHFVQPLRCIEPRHAHAHARSKLRHTVTAASGSNNKTADRSLGGPSQ